MSKCENCGIPEGSYAFPGYKLRMPFLEGDNWKRRAWRTVWLCGPNCAMQSVAIAALGLPTHKWPLTLKQFTKLMFSAQRLDWLRKWPQEAPVTVEFRDLVSSYLEPVTEVVGESLDAVEPVLRGKDSEPSAVALRVKRFRERQKAKALT
jgi:hypothetical protein